MIVTRTPYRVSFAGGGTDLPAFFRQEGGVVLSAAIDRSFRFNRDDTVDVEPVLCRDETIAELERRALLFYSGQTREAASILDRQANGTGIRLETLRALRDLAGEMRLALADEGDLDRFAELLHQGWMLKRSLDRGISTERVDAWYAAARRAGAQGGKLLGAGGGGLLLLLAPPGRPPGARPPPRAAVPHRATGQPAVLHRECSWQS